MSRSSGGKMIQPGGKVDYVSRKHREENGSLRYAWAHSRPRSRFHVADLDSGGGPAGVRDAARHVRSGESKDRHGRGLSARGRPAVCRGPGDEFYGADAPFRVAAAV